MKAAFLSVILAAVASSQTTLNLSRDLVRLGITQSNMVPDQPTADAGPLLFRGVLYAQSHQIRNVIADPGAYYFRSLQVPTAHVVWNGLSDITINLQRADLYFTNTFASGIIIQHGSQVVLENFTADYDPLPFTQARVLTVDPAQRKIQFATAGGWRNPSALNAVFNVPSAGPSGIELHIFRNGRSIQGVPRMYAVNPVGSADFTVQNQFGNSVQTALSLIRPGDMVFMGMRTAAAGPVALSFCDGCTLRNITSYSSVEWGIARDRILRMVRCAHAGIQGKAGRLPGQHRREARFHLEQALEPAGKRRLAAEAARSEHPLSRRYRDDSGQDRSRRGPASR
jgi:hypothetical protein